MTEPAPWTPPGAPPPTGPQGTAPQQAGPRWTAPPAPAPQGAAPTQSTAPSQPSAFGPASAAYPYGGAYPPPPVKPKQTLSVVAFVLGVLGCIPLASIAAVVVGAVALAKERAGRAFAVAGIVLGTLWTVLGVVLVATDAPQRFGDAVQESVRDLGVPADGELDSRLTEDLAVGDCFDDPFVGDFSFDTDREIAVVDCAEPHDLEVFDVFRLDEYSDPGTMFEDTDEACIEAFEDFVGIDYYRSELLVYTYYPSRESWDAGTRTVTCAVNDFGPTTGTLRGANR